MRSDRSTGAMPAKIGASCFDWRHVPLLLHIEQDMNFVSGSAPSPSLQLTGGCLTSSLTL